jgi:hypothetical protein
VGDFSMSDDENAGKAVEAWLCTELLLKLSVAAAPSVAGDVADLVRRCPASSPACAVFGGVLGAWSETAGKCPLAVGCE